MEYYLGRTFKNSNRTDTKGFWCDGEICEPISQAELSETHGIKTRAWMGKDGQGEFAMTIRFGEVTLDKFFKGENLKDTIPSEESMDWIDIDNEKRIIEVRLK